MSGRHSAKGIILLRSFGASEDKSSAPGSMVAGSFAGLALRSCAAAKEGHGVLPARTRITGTLEPVMRWVRAFSPATEAL